jgi:hypothetical protein
MINRLKLLLLLRMMKLNMKLLLLMLLLLPLCVSCEYSWHGTMPSDMYQTADKIQALQQIMIPKNTQAFHMNSIVIFIVLIGSSITMGTTTTTIQQLHKQNVLVLRIILSMKYFILYVSNPWHKTKGCSSLLHSLGFSTHLNFLTGHSPQLGQVVDDLISLIKKIRKP